MSRPPVTVCTVTDLDVKAGMDAGAHFSVHTKDLMSRIFTCAAIAGVALVCTTSTAFADDDAYTTDRIAPTWTAESAESCADPDVSPLLTAFKDKDYYAPAPGGTFEAGAAGWQLEGGAAVVA